LKILSEANLVSSIRGAEGGYHLARPAAEITVVDIITAMEGNLAMTECCEKSSLCAIDSHCTMRVNWQKINKMIHSLLARFTIKDMLTPISVSAVLEAYHDK
jgi:Rrf2 family protein